MAIPDNFGGGTTAIYDPLVIDLNRDGQTDLTNRVFFDMDVNGFAESTAWIDASDGLLVMDRNPM
ncbi:hypothetical protein FACS1894167_13670 [Synergistales bacterium]|nr:hypothetical protein FACS1894167_13670 [Synergistales bacterium]